MIPFSTLWSTALVLATVVALGIATPDAQAQPTERSVFSPNPPPRTLRVVQLQHVNPNSMNKTILELMGDSVRVMPDARINALIVFANDDDFAMVQSLIESVDVPVDQPNELMQVWSIKYANAVELLDTMKNLRSSREVRLAVDERNNQIIAQGSTSALDQLGDLVVQLDQPIAEERSTPAETNVRLLWLVSDDDAAIGRETPDDLRGVTAELSRLGISNLRLVAQSVLRVTNGEDFQNDFITRIDIPWRVEIRGLIEPAGDGRHLAIRVEGRTMDQVVMQPGSTNRRTTQLGATGILDIETAITTPLGQFVVLGAAPIVDRDSVFVLQLLDQPTSN